MSTPGTPHFNLPNLVFDNRTAHAASQFDMVDQFGEGFHVVVARMAYTLGPCGADGVATLQPFFRPTPLLTEDRHLNGDTEAGTVQESDFAPYKPHCDVIVMARPMRRWAWRWKNSPSTSGWRWPEKQ